MPDVNMPKLSDTMEEGTIVEWKKKSGEQVKAGEVLAEVESDKATFDLEAETDGVLQILVEQGVPAKIGAPIAKIGEGGGEAPAKEAPPKQASSKKAVANSETQRHFSTSNLHCWFRISVVIGLIWPKGRVGWLRYFSTPQQQASSFLALSLPAGVINSAHSHYPYHQR